MRPCPHYILYTHMTIWSYGHMAYGPMGIWAYGMWHGIQSYGHMGIWDMAYGHMSKRNCTLTRRAGEVGGLINERMNKLTNA